MLTAITTLYNLPQNSLLDLSNLQFYIVLLAVIFLFVIYCLRCWVCRHRWDPSLRHSNWPTLQTPVDLNWTHSVKRPPLLTPAWSLQRYYPGSGRLAQSRFR